MNSRSVLWRVWRAAIIVATLTTASGHSVAQDRELNESPDFRVRVQAALRLGRAGGAARADLENGLRDAHPAVRVACTTALGNIGDAGDARVVATLERHLRHPDPMLRSHAVWAVRRLGRDDLLQAVASDGAPEVIDELAAPPPPVRVSA